MNPLKQQLAALPAITVGGQQYLSYQAVTDTVAAFLFPEIPADEIGEADYHHILKTAAALCHELIPTHPSPPEMPHAWLKEQLLHLVSDANRLDGRRNAFEFLSGRPMGSNENYSHWFEQQLEAQGGELSHAQLFTLFVWAHSEWRRSRQREFTLPVNGNGMQFATYRERSFPD